MTQRTATWLGGPWDGKTMEVPDGIDEVPVMDPEQLRDETDVEFEGIVGIDVEPPQPLRVCPVVEQPDGRLVIDWAAGAPE